MTIEIKIVLDPFAFAGPVPRERMTKEEMEHIKRGVARQEEIDERHRRKLIEKGVLRPRNETEEKWVLPSSEA